jgi:hypothetical protein
MDPITLLYIATAVLVTAVFGVTLWRNRDEIAARYRRHRQRARCPCA